MKKIFKVLVTVILVLGALVTVRLLIVYMPFLRAQKNFNLTYNDNETTIENSQFGISFKMDGECNLDPEVVRRLLGDFSWSGYLYCSESPWLVMRVISENDQAFMNPENEIDIFYDGKIEMFKSEALGATWISLQDEENNTYLILGSPSNELIERIIQEIKFIE